MLYQINNSMLSVVLEFAYSLCTYLVTDKDIKVYHSGVVIEVVNNEDIDKGKDISNDLVGYSWRCWLDEKEI